MRKYFAIAVLVLVIAAWIWHPGAGIMVSLLLIPMFAAHNP